MKTLPIIGFILAAFLATAGTAAAGELDGKAIICGGVHIVFEEGRAVSHTTKGYSKTIVYKQTYELIRTHSVAWSTGRIHYELDRQTLKLSFAGIRTTQCRLSSKNEIFGILDAQIAEAKKKNKL